MIASKSENRPLERTLIESLAVRLNGRHPDEPLPWVAQLIEGWWGLRAGRAKLTTQAFQYSSFSFEQGSSVRIELSQMIEVHLTKSAWWSLVIYIYDTSGNWYTFRLNTFGGWQRRFREVSRDATFRLIEGTSKETNASA
jgi:hypothetical protein